MSRLRRKVLIFVGLAVMVASGAMASEGDADCLAAQREIQRIYALWRGADITTESNEIGEAARRAVERHERQTDELRKLSVLEIVPEEIAGERRRVERDTKDRRRLEQLYAALGQDRALIDRCLLRPLTVARALDRLREADTSIASNSTRTERGSAGAPDSWSPLSTAGAPEARTDHTAVWTGSQMVVWGGLSDAGEALGDGDATIRSWTSGVQRPW